MITLGTEWGRNMIHPDLWVKALEWEIRGLVEQGIKHFVIDDLRFHNEVNWFRTIPEYIIVKLERQGLEQLTHQSEVEIDTIDADFHIYNNKDKQYLYKTLDSILELNKNNPLIR